MDNNKLMESPAQAVEAEVVESSLTSVEHVALLQHEQTIENGLKGYYEMGLALSAIRDRRLYRDGYSSFEEYCQTKFGIVRQQAYRLITAASVAQNLQITGSIPQTESQARELASLPADAQRVVWDRIKEEETPITARKIQEVAAEVAPEYVQPKPKPQPTPTPVQSPEPTPTQVCEVKPQVKSGAFEFDLSPQVVLDIVLEVCGEIDLDPCSNDVENPHVPATAHYAADGLSEERIWVGNIYCYPPTDNLQTLNHWVFRMKREVEAGNCRNGFLYLPLAEINRWLRPLAHYFFAVISGQDKAMALAYLGDNHDEFREACRKRAFYLLGTVE